MYFYCRGHLSFGSGFMVNVSVEVTAPQLHWFPPETDKRLLAFIHPAQPADGTVSVHGSWLVPVADG